MKKNLLIGAIKVLTLTMVLMIFPAITNADNEELEVDKFEIMPRLNEAELNRVNTAIKEIGNEGGKVWENYNKNASGMTTSEQISSGIMTRNTIMNYLVFVVQFLSQLGLLVGAGFIMFAGYKYMTSVFNGGKVTGSTLKNAIIGVIIVIFSFAIMRILTSIIGLT